MPQDPPIERGQRNVDAGRAEVGNQQVAGVSTKCELAWRAAARAGAGLALHEQAPIQELADPLDDDAAGQARVVAHLGA
jgi:hypothetical protein